ncbi:MAG: glucose-6-phosphate isomerase family protein, partial [Caldilineaceae bacterium]
MTSDSNTTFSPTPYGFQLDGPGFVPSHYDNHIQRLLSSMTGQYADADAFGRELRAGDRLLYEVYEFKRPTVAGELLHGISIVQPGKVGAEYQMTKGHYHEVLETGE